MKFRVLLVVLLISVASWGQFNINAFATNYTQDFNGMASSGTGITWTDNTTLTGWYARTDNTASISAYGTNTGTTLTAGLYSFGVAGTNPVTDRALGYASSNAFIGPSGTGKGYYGWRLRNNTGAPISSITITWTGEQWRDYNTTAQTLNLFYRTGTNVTDLIVGTWTAAPSTFTSPKIVNSGALDGNATANRTANITVTITVLIPANEEIMLRWEDLNDGGNDHFIAIDDVTINATPVCTPPSDPTGSITGTTPACNSTTLSFSGSASAPVVNYWQTSATGQSLVLGSAASPLTASTIGTTNYYVRAFNSSTSCWSTNSVGPYVVTVNAVPTVTPNSMSPISLTIPEGTPYDFVVTTSSLGSYQWQVDTGSGFTNITGATTPTLSITNATLAMSGYKYKCLVLAIAPCGGGVSSGIWTLTVNPTSDNKSDLFYVVGSSPATISSTMNDAAPLSSTTGVQAMQFLLRDGGATGLDTDALPTILTGFTISQVTNTATDWSAAIKTIALFDGSTFVANGVITASSIVFSGLSVSTITDGASRTLSLRMSLNCPLGSVIDGEYFGFSISNVNTTVAATGSSTMTTFTAIQNSPATGGTLRIAVVATRLLFTTQPNSTGVNNTMTTVVVKATDACGNLDVDFTGSVSLISSGTMTAVAPVVAVAGVATFSNIVHTATGSNLFLTASSTVTAAVSTFFDIVLVTVFNPGELLFVGYDGQVSAANDEYLIATLVDIKPKTQFSIVNSRYEAGAAANIRTNKWGGGGDEAKDPPYTVLITYNGITNIPAGSVLAITTNGSANWFGNLDVITGVTTTNRTSEFSGSLVFGLVNNPNISTSASDQLYLIQGSFVSDGIIDNDEANYFISGRLLHGLTNRAAWVPFSNACNGNNTGGNTRESRLPTELTCFNVESVSTSGISGFYQNDKEHGIASIRQIINAVANVASNWTLGSGRYTKDPTSSSSTRAAKTFLVGPSNPAGSWVGDVSGDETNWFNCGNWEGLKVPDSTTDVVLNASSTNNAVIDYTDTYSDTYLDIAKCNNLTITNRTVTIEASSSNVLEVNGNLAISATGTLDMDDSTAAADGIIKLKGYWTNTVGDAAFSEGNGTVEFVGTTAQVISSVATEGTEIFYNVVLDNNFDTALSNDLIASGDLTIKTARTVNIDSNGYIKAYKALNHSGDLTIQSNGQFIQVDDIVNTGTYTGTKFQVMRNYTATNVDYVYWGAPTKSFAVSNLPNGFRYEWNPIFDNTLNGTQGNWIAPSTANMTAGKGYIARTFNGSATAITLPFTFRGEPNNGTITIPISRGSYFGDGITTGLPYDAEPSNPNNLNTTRWDDNWNLVSNPYPSAINALTFLSTNSNIEGFVYLWTHQQGLVSTVDPYYYDFGLNYSAAANYVLYNSLGVSSGPASFNGKIASGQGFFVLMSDGAAVNGTENVTFNNSMRFTASTIAPYDNSQFYRTNNSMSTPLLGEEEKHRIWLDIVSAQGDSNRTLIGYVENATNDKDRVYDAITRLDNSLKIVSYLNQENPQEFSIQGRGLPFDQDDTVRLGVAIPSNGTYKIGIGAIDGMFAGNQNIYIEDKQLNIIQSIKTQPYTFTSNSGQFNNRFVLRYTNGSALDNPDFETLNNSVVVATNQGELTIKSYIENIQNVTVYDILGRQLFEAKGINNTELIASNISISTQALIVKIKLGNGTIVTRKIVL